MALRLEIVTPAGSVVDTEVDEVTLPGVAGQFGVLERHIPLLAALDPGVLRYIPAGGRGAPRTMAIDAGFAEVGAGERVLVLTERHVDRDDVDLDAVRRELADVDAAMQDWDGAITAEWGELESRARWARAQLALRGS